MLLSTVLSTKIDSMSRDEKATVAAARTGLAGDLEFVSWAAGETRRALAGSEFGDVLEAGEHLRQIRQAAETGLLQWATLAVSAGASWRQIGDVLGVSRQAAQQRYGHLVGSGGLGASPS